VLVGLSRRVRLPQASSIAVIDDDELVRRTMSSLIRSLGLDARTFPSADAFLESGERAFDCLLSDVQMPGTDGLELQQIVSGWPHRPPMIIMSGDPRGMREAAMAGGAACYIEKPVDGEELIACLEDVLGPLQ
jgi:FixJ family two-component response regulator